MPNWQVKTLLSVAILLVFLGLGVRLGIEVQATNIDADCKKSGTFQVSGTIYNCKSIPTERAKSDVSKH